ncbi:ABC transporter substrate-binding protein [Bifidobacterium ramosum]|nr:ABC transporter substrate-binding protein [Bifidobacterium ramosum]
MIFVATAVALSAIVWVVWSLATHRDILPSGASVHSQTTVSVGLTDAPQSLDIRTDDSPAVERALLGNVYETLVSRDEHNQLVAGLAKRWTTSDDGLTYTFTLRSGLRFANGDTLDSSDVVWSLQQIVRNKYVGADDLAGLKSVTNPDATTVTVTLAHTDPTLLRALAGRAGIVYDQQAGMSTSGKAADTVGSGPFTVSGFAAGKSVTLTRNERYWGDASAAATVTLRYYGDDKALVEAARKGDVDVAMPANAAAAAGLAKQDPSLTVASGTSTSKVMLAFNNDDSSIFSDQQARQTVRYAVDAKSIAASQADSAGALGGPISQLEPGYEDLTSLFPFDQGKASQMIAYFAGGTSYFGVINFVVPQDRADLGNTIADQLRAVGLSVNVQTVDDATLDERIANGQYTMALTTMDGTDDAAVFGSSDNRFHYTSGSAQETYAKAMAATNDDAYAAAMKTFAKTVSEDAAADWLYTRKTTVVATSRASGYPTNLTDQYLPLGDLTIK